MWDLESGRELITLPMPDGEDRINRGPIGPQMRFADDRLEALTANGIRVYDGASMPDKK